MSETEISSTYGRFNLIRRKNNHVVFRSDETYTNDTKFTLKEIVAKVGWFESPLSFFVFFALKLAILRCGVAMPV